MRSKLAAWIVLVLLGLRGGAVCASSEEVKISLWHSYRGSELAALEEVRARFAATRPGFAVELVQVPFESLTDRITSSVREGTGPDLFIFGHDRIGAFSEQGVLEPLDRWVGADARGRFVPIAVEAVTYRGKLRALPLALKSVALIYSRKLVETPPRTTAELVRVARRLTDRKQNRFGLVYENRLTYCNAAWLHAFGGGIFDEKGRPTLDCPGNVRALQFIRDLDSGDLMPREITGPLVTALFNQNQAAMVISGPWFLGEVDRRVEVGVAPLPRVPGSRRRPAPFLTVEAIHLTASSPHKPEAARFMIDLTGTPSAVVMATRGGQPVANAAAYEDPAVRRSPTIAGFRRQAEAAVLTTNRPEMGLVWQPFDVAIRSVLGRLQQPGAALAEAQARLLTAIAGARTVGR